MTAKEEIKVQGIHIEQTQGAVTGPGAGAESPRKSLHLTQPTLRAQIHFVPEGSVMAYWMAGKVLHRVVSYWRYSMTEWLQGGLGAAVGYWVLWP